MPCQNKATWWVFDNPEPGPDEYTMSCDEHLQDMQTGTGSFAVGYGGDTEKCCFVIHASDCAIHNEPYLSNKSCNCGAVNVSNN